MEYAVVCAKKTCKKQITQDQPNVPAGSTTAKCTQNALDFLASVMAAAMSMTFGRGGALLGNLIFGLLIDLNCIIPIIIFSGMLFGKYLIMPLPSLN
ncbi:GL21881 [Drosophila persimilis]|uniref:GL21881 n=1 Tax=Drosophila persimilis TaxID=7234 RepID=B4GE65_DROPE|nr:GL21881 [Drosophila persimilis]